MAGTVTNYLLHKLTIQTGDTPTPLEKVIPYVTPGSFTLTETVTGSDAMERGKFDLLYAHRVPGVEQALSWAVEVEDTDTDLLRHMRELAFPRFVQTVAGYTANSANAPANAAAAGALSYAYEQNTLTPASTEVTEATSKLALDAAVTSAGEFSEATGVENLQRVVLVPSFGLKVFMSLAGVSVTWAYTALGLSTNTGFDRNAVCPSGAKLFNLIFEVNNPNSVCSPSPVPLQRITIKNAYLLDSAFTASEEKDTRAFSGGALTARATIEDLRPIP